MATPARPPRLEATVRLTHELLRIYHAVFVYLVSAGALYSAAILALLVWGNVVMTRTQIPEIIPNSVNTAATLSAIALSSFAALVYTTAGFLKAAGKEQAAALFLRSAHDYLLVSFFSAIWLINTVASRYVMDPHFWQAPGLANAAWHLLNSLVQAVSVFGGVYALVYLARAVWFLARGVVWMAQPALEPAPPAEGA